MEMDRPASSQIHVSLGNCSGTAILAAAGRAIGARESDPRARNPDVFAEKFIGNPSDLDSSMQYAPVVRALSQTYEAAMLVPDVARFVRLMTVRTRFIDEELYGAIADGIRQVVIVGAGFDSRAYRCKPCDGLRIFEVDHISTQDVKRKRVETIVGEVPSLLSYVPADIRNGSLASALVSEGFDTTQGAFFIMEGISVYLTQNVLVETLRFISGCAAGSRIVMDFVASSVIQNVDRMLSEVAQSRRFPQRDGRLEVFRSEPWRWGIDVGSEREFFDDIGLSMGALMGISSREAEVAFLTRADGTQAGKPYLGAKNGSPFVIAKPRDYQIAVAHVGH